MDESEEQTRRIHERQRLMRTERGLQLRQEADAIARRHWNAQRLLEPLPVVIPYADQLTFPTAWMRTRRDHARFLNLIEVSAFLHQYQRERRGGAIVAVRRPITRSPTRSPARCWPTPSSDLKAAAPGGATTRIRGPVARGRRDRLAPRDPRGPGRCRTPPCGAGSPSWSSWSTSPSSRRQQGRPGKTRALRARRARGAARTLVLGLLTPGRAASAAAPMKPATSPKPAKPPWRVLSP